MLVTVLVFAWLLIKNSCENADFYSINKICSKIIATPNNKTEPLLIKADRLTTIFSGLNHRFDKIDIKDGECTIPMHHNWKPCNYKEDYINISMKNGPSMDQLVAMGTNYWCVLNFAPKCIFKHSQQDQLILEASYPFIRYAKGEESVKINLSIRNCHFHMESYLNRANKRLCSWRGSKLVFNSQGQRCGNFTINTRQDRLDYTFRYFREDNEQITTLSFQVRSSYVGVTIDWTKEGVSPDITECQNNVAHGTRTEMTPIAATSSGFPIRSISPS
nr:hypothetical transcript [Hymenolepis microstoma]